MSDNQVLHLRIEQNGNTVHRYVKEKETFFIGQHAKNDLTLLGQQYPKRHPLFVQKGKGFLLFLPAFAQGEIKANNSQLRFADLIEHDLLPRSKGYFTYEIKPGRMGFIFIDSTRIDFIIEATAARPVPVANKFEGFDPVKVFWKSLKEDALFKGIVTALLLLNIGTLYGLRGYIPPPKPKVELDLAAQRLTKFVIKNTTPPPAPEPVLTTTRPTSEENQPKDAPEQKQPEPQKTPEPAAKKRRNPSNMGVLALLTGSGSSNRDNAVIDNLLSNNLAASVDQMTRSGRLQVGKSNEGDSNTDELLSLLASDGGIEDLIGSQVGQVESVNLSGKGSIQIETIGEISGSEEAVGARSEASLYDVLQKNMGRLTYIYNTYLRQNPNFRGLMRVEVTIASDGSVASVQIISSNMGNSGFEQDILSAIRRFRYDSIASGSLKVVYPLSFFRQS